MKFNYKRTIFIGLAFLSITAFWQFYDNEIPKILKYTFDLGETATGAIMALDNILALFLLPIFGILSDRCSSVLGKRMPFILFGTGLSGFLLEHVSYRTLFPYAFLFSTLAFFTMLMVRHGDSRPEIKENILENFDVED